MTRVANDTEQREVSVAMCVTKFNNIRAQRIAMIMKQISASKKRNIYINYVKNIHINNVVFNLTSKKSKTC